MFAAHFWMKGRRPDMYNHMCYVQSYKCFVHWIAHVLILEADKPGGRQRDRGKAGPGLVYASASQPKTHDELDALSSGLVTSLAPLLPVCRGQTREHGIKGDWQVDTLTPPQNGKNPMKGLRFGSNG